MWLALPTLLAAAAVGLPVATSVGQSGSLYVQTNLVSDIPGVARITDPNLVNPWGLSTVDGSPLWVADNGTNKSTLYTGGVDGSAPAPVPLVVRIQGGAPDGTVGNTTDSNDFLVTTSMGTAPATFMFVSENGFLTAWSHAVSGTLAQTEFAGGNSTVYKGLALGSVGMSNFLYATNFRAARIDVFDGNFKRVKFGMGTFGPGAFQDPRIPSGYAPFGIQSINGNLYVSYAKQDAAKHDDVAGPGHGFVDVFNTAGVLQQRLISRGALNSPWGLVLAPASFGGFGGDLLVGNFGDGQIHAYDPNTGDLVGTLTNIDDNPITINGLWGLRFGNGTFGAPGALVFAAGIADESHGLLGEITPKG
jgi:uncharacterized protein (TIGR03118 family)